MSHETKAYQMELANLKQAKTNKQRELTPDFKEDKIKLNLAHAEKLLGIKLNEKQIKQLLEKMGYNYSKGQVLIPAWRVDILHEVDIIEDIAIAYGYENFTPEIPKISTIGQEDSREILKRKFSEILSGLGFLEVSNYHLTTKQDQIDKMQLSLSQEKEIIEVESSKTEYHLLRKDLSHYILKNLAENVDAEYPQKIFEIGRIFRQDPEKNEEVIEEENLAIAITPGNFTELRQALEYLSRMASLNLKFSTPTTQTDLITPDYFIEGRVAEISCKDKIIGFLGEVHPKTLKAWKIKMPVALCEISLREI